MKIVRSGDRYWVDEPILMMSFTEGDEPIFSTPLRFENVSTKHLQIRKEVQCW